MKQRMSYLTRGVQLHETRDELPNTGVQLHDELPNHGDANP